MVNDQQVTFAKLQDFDNEVNDFFESSILSRTWKYAISLAWSFFITYEILIGIKLLHCY